MVHKHSRFIMLFIVLIMIFIVQSVDVTAKTENSLSYEGEDYLIELKFGKEAKIPEEAQLRVKEICEGTLEFQDYFSEMERYMDKENKREVRTARFFDVCIWDGEKEIEPHESVLVTITYKEGVYKEKSNDVSVIHFVDAGDKELLKVTNEEQEENLLTEISFEQESFSVIGMIIFDGVDTSIKSSSSEVISETDVIQVKKTWSDGQNLHKNEAIKVCLYKHTDGKDVKVEELTLSSNNGWKGEFKNLDKKSKYSIKEEAVISGNMDVTKTYKSVITNEYVKQWCPTENNQLVDGKKILLCLDNNTKALRKSADYDEMNLRIYNVEVSDSAIYGQYCKTEVTNNCIWISKWNEEKQAWNLYNEEGNAYLSLIYNDANGVYEWTTSREIVEGSHLTFFNGEFSATVEEVTKYLGNVSGNGPYEGVDRKNSGITKFKIFFYKVCPPVVCNIYNEKNETPKEHELNVDVITKKTIDYLGDGEENFDTDADNGVLSDNILKDLYRLDLNVQMKTDVTGLDLLMVIDVSSSMEGYRDAKDDEGNLIKRSEALRQALNRFVPEFLPENTKNRIAIVAFESESMILQEWTNESTEILDKVNYEVNGQMPLYSGEGTNYEAALARAHEALTMRGYSNNAVAMLFLSDGDPTMHIEGNDELEEGNVTINMGEASLSNTGIECIYPEELKVLWGVDDGKAFSAADEATTSFHKHNPEIIVGSVAFNTKLTDYIKNLATDSKFVTRIENGSPKDLIYAMELITEYVPSELMITDELSENVELYEEHPDMLVKEYDGTGKEFVLFSTKTGITDRGKKILDEKEPVKIEKQTVKLLFNPEYIMENKHTYHLSFNVNISQQAMNRYADQKGIYLDKGDEDTDFKNNTTSSLKEGFYSNGEGTYVTYSLNGAKITKKYRKPVVQAREGTLTLKKTDQNGKVISTGAEFELYRQADDNEANAVKLEGLEKPCIKVAGGTTGTDGRLVFEHLRVAVFEEGYPYYLVETMAPEGYVKIENPIEVLVTENKEITVKNGVFSEFKFTKVNAEGEALEGAKFELSVLLCSDLSHKHEEKCFVFVANAVSNPDVSFKEMSTGKYYRVKEVEAPEGYLCPEGYWMIHVNEKGEFVIENILNSPEFELQENRTYNLKNDKELSIPVTGGKGNITYLMIGIVLILGGILMNKRKSFSNLMKMLALVLVAVQMFSMTAFAIEKEEKGNITVNGIESKVTVNVYQLMDVNYDYKVNQPQNPMYQWRAEVSEWIKENYPAYIDEANSNEVKEEFSNATDKTVAELYDKLAVAIKAGRVNLPKSSVEASSDTVKINNLTMGNYFILIEGGVKVYRPLTANVVPEWKDTKWAMSSPIVEAKASEPVITKVMVDGIKKDNMNIGDVISYEITAVVPDYPVNALAKKFVISDKLSKGLTLMDNSLKVYGVNHGEEAVLLTDGFSKTTQRPVSAVKDNDVTFSYDFTYESIRSYNSIKITYNAVLNEEAFIGKGGNINTAYLDYNNNPYVESSWKTDDDNVMVYTYGLKVLKVDETTGEGLKGAQFRLEKNGKEILFAGKDGDYHVAKEDENGVSILTVNSDGEMILNGLDAAEYVLTEEKAPDGYIKLQNPITIKIEDQNLDGKAESNNKESEDGYISLTVENDKGFTLPVTGGMGSTVFCLVGVAMVCAGGVLIATYFRKKANT